MKISTTINGLSLCYRFTYTECVKALQTQPAGEHNPLGVTVQLPAGMIKIKTREKIAQSDEKQCFINPTTVMKPRKQNLIITALAILLAWSIMLNLLQGEQVERLMKEIEDMEYTQSILSSQIDELERTEGVEYED